MKISVTKEFRFEAAHHLPNYDGACRNLHGHSYKLEVEVAGIVGSLTGMIIDFSDLKNTVKMLVISPYDHSDLNNHFDMPTAENMCSEIFKRLSSAINNQEFIKVVRVRLWETSTSYAEAKAE